MTNSKDAKEIILANEKTLLFYTSIMALGDRRFRILKTTDGALGYSAMGLHIGSELHELFNYYLLMTQERAIFKRIYNAWTAPRTEVFSVPDPLVLGLVNTFFPFGVLASGILVAIVLAACEAMVPPGHKKKYY